MIKNLKNLRKQRKGLIVIRIKKVVENKNLILHFTTGLLKMIFLMIIRKQRKGLIVIRIKKVV